MLQLELIAPAVLRLCYCWRARCHGRRVRAGQGLLSLVLSPTTYSVRRHIWRIALRIDDGSFSCQSSVAEERLHLCNAGGLVKAYSEPPMQLNKANS